MLRLAARHGRLCLIAGLVLGLSFPSATLALKPWLPELIAAMIFTAAFRIGARDAWGRLRALPDAIGTVLALQLALPLAAVAGLVATGLAGTPFGLAAVLMMAAPSITGSPNLTILVGHDPAPALRLMILGTALFPVTVAAILWLHPAIGDAEAARAGLGLLLTIAGVTGAAFALRHVTLGDVSAEQRQALDGAGALLMAIAVIGLLAGLSPLLRQDPARAVLWVAAAMALNIGLQVAAFALLRHRSDRVAKSVIAGNRNIALFLVALPASVTDPVLPFIGAYQLPMYLTPVLLAPLYRANAATLSAPDR